MDEEVVETLKSHELSNYQKNPLNYRPEEYVPPKKEDTGGFIRDVDLVDEDDLQDYYVDEEKDIGDGLLTDEINKTNEILTTTELLIHDLNEELKLYEVSVPSKFSDELSRAKDSLNLPNVDALTFNDYVEALDHKDSYSGQFIIGLFEEQVEDIDGNLKAELYADLVETKEEILHLQDYIQRMILDKLGLQNIDFQKKQAMDSVLEAEKQFKENKDKTDTIYSDSYQKYVEALTIDPRKLMMSKESLYLSKKEYQKYDVYKKDLDTAYFILSNKNMDLKNSINTISENLERETLPNTRELVSNLLTVSDSKEDANKALTNIGLMLKLSVDSDNEEKYALKNQLRSHYSIDKREKLLSEYEVDQKLHDVSVLDLTHRFNFYDKEVDDASTVFLNSVSRSMIKTFEVKEQKDKEYFNVSEQSSLLRDKKLENVFTKDDARQSYQFAKELSKVIETKGFPTVSDYDDYLS